MAARAIGSGTISFGLVAIPVKICSTMDSTRSVHFNYLSTDGSRLRQQYIRASDGEVVDREDRVQGYEFAKGQYVTFTDEEIKAMHLEATNAIDIAEFVALDQVELRSFDDVPLEPTAVNADELALALTIIDQRVNDKFEPERYEDEVRTIMMGRIQQKIDGQETSLPPEEAAESKIVDLMEALKASVDESGKRKPAKRATKRIGVATAAAKAKPGKPRAKPSKRTSG